LDGSRFVGKLGELNERNQWGAKGRRKEDTAAKGEGGLLTWEEKRGWGRPTPRFPVKQKRIPF